MRKQNLFISISPKSGSLGKIKKSFINEFLKADFMWQIKPITYNVQVNIVFYFKRKEYKGDIDNLLKSFFDAMIARRMLINDKQIRKVIAEIKDDSLLEGISLSIVPYGFKY